MLFKNEKHNKLWEKAANLTLALIYVFFVYRFFIDLVQTQRLSVLILMIYETMIVYFLLTRAMPIKVSTRPYDWCIAVLGTWVPLTMQPSTTFNEIWFLNGLQVVGFLISMIGLYSLSKSFGIVAANRGIKMDGIYRFIRHPLYTGYILSVFCFVAQNITVWNIVMYVAMIILLVLRVLSEERLLSEDSEYKTYMQKTKYRFIPYIW